MNRVEELIRNWHQIIDERDASRIDPLLADDVVFHSPVVHTPQAGRAITSLYLKAAFNVLLNDSFKYVREIVGEHDAVLEFVTEIDGVVINGVDIVSVNAEGKISDFKVMVRPLKAVNIIHQKMAEMLERYKASQPA